MSKVKIIHWDDNSAEKIDTGKILKDVFGIDNYDYFFYSSSIEDFEQILSKEKYDLLILDLLDKDNNLVGDRILKQLNTEDKVIVFTGDANSKVDNQLKDPLIKVKFPIVYKVLGHHDAFDQLVPAIEKLTPLKRIVQQSTYELKWDKNDINTVNLISYVTEDHLKNLMTLYFNYMDFKPNSVVIKAISSGHSGASVFHLIILQSERTIDNLLKVDKIKNNLELELASAIRTNYRQLREYRVNYHSQLLHSNSYVENTTWYGIISDFLVEGKTLKNTFLNAILDKSEDNDFDGIFRTIFWKCLTNMYERNQKKYNQSALIYPIGDIMKIIDDRRQAFILNTVEELSVVSNEIVKCKIEDIFNFNSSEKALDQKKIGSYNKIVLVHGDLHADNVMLSEYDELRIIDPAHMKDDHWTRDICMLIVDLFAYGFDYGDKEYFGITRISEWRNLGKNIFAGAVLKDGERNKVVCETLSYLTNEENFKTNYGFGPWFESWEFQLSLVLEFLKISYKSNRLPAGKRAVCLLIALDGFEKVKESYNIFIQNKKK